MSRIRHRGRRGAFARPRAVPSEPLAAEVRPCEWSFCPVWKKIRDVD